MPAKLQVQGGRFHGKQYWIEEDVIRIGGDPSCNLVIPECAPHAVTLQYRQGEYWVFNRVGEEVRINGRDLSSTDAVVWDSAEHLQVAADVDLKLLVEGRSAPSSAPVRPIEGFEDEDDEDEMPQQEAKMAVPLAILAGCTLLILAMLFDASGDNGPARIPEHQQFEQLVASLAAPTQGSGGESIGSLLQRARYHELRKDYDEAMLCYKTVRDLLMRHRESDGSFASRSHSDAYQFVKTRMTIVGPRVSSGSFF